MEYFMGIDLGTSSVKSLLMKADGEIIDVAQEGYDIKKPEQQYAQQDMNLLWKAAGKTIQRILGNHPEAKNCIKGIGYSGQMHGLVMIDKNGELLDDAIIWADQRSAEEIKEIYSVIPAEEYKKIVLNSLSTGFLISSLMWIKKHKPEIYAKIYKVMLPKDYLRYKMCGELGTDMSDASSTAVFDIKKRQWAWEFIDRLGLERSFFVPCHESNEIAGEVTDKCEKELGFAAGTKIVYGGGDSLMQAVGNGIVSPGILSSNIGTASQLNCPVNEPLYDLQYRTNTFCHVQENSWMLMGANLSGGVSLKWLMNNILDMKSYDEMTALAETIPAGSNGLLFLPYLSGERTPYNDPDARGMYLGLTLKHTKADMIRSTMEGIVFGLKHSLEIFRDMGVDFQRILASGGGARGKLFRQIQADMFGKEIYTSMGQEQACMGAAITAAVGTGTYQSYAEACGKIICLSPEITVPDVNNQKIYEERFEIYKEMYPRNKDLFSCSLSSEGL